MREKKLFFVGNSLATMINFRGHTIKALYEKGYKIVLVVPGNDAVNPTFEKTDVEVIFAGSSGRSSGVLRFLDICREYRRIFNRFSGYDLVIFPYSPRIILTTLIACINSSHKVHAWFIGLGAVFLNPKLNWLQFVFLSILKRSKNLRDVIVLNVQDQEFLRERLGREVLLIKGEGLPEDRFVARDFPAAHTVRFILVSRPFKEKGVEVFLDSVRDMRNRGLHNPVCIFGFDESCVEHDLRETFFDECQELHVELKGFVNRIESSIQDMDVLVLPSKREGCSRTCMEMIRLGVPIIASKVPGIEGLVIDGVSGTLIEKNTFLNIADGMEKYAILGKKGYALLRQEILSSNATFATNKEVLDFYINLISDKGEKRC